MSKPLTVRELYTKCMQEIRKGHADHVIMLSDDDEGNGYHYCWFSFTDVDEYMADYVDEDIAPADKTIVLG